jgi:Cyclin-dependent kinase inhibitor 3 (CDKN3)
MSEPLQMTHKPFPQSFWVHDGLLCAGCYPGDQNPAMRDVKLRGLLDCDIRRVLSLMESTERGHDGHPFEPYEQRLLELAVERKVVVECISLPIPDACAPPSAALQKILVKIEIGLRERTPTYLHCWGGHGRTGTVIACHLIQIVHSTHQAIEALLAMRADLPKNHYPFEGNQERFVRSFLRSQASPEALP